MCVDDGCDELICCLCAPIAAILCCKVCKDKMGPNNVNQAPEPSYYQQPTGPIPAAGVYGPQGYGPRSHNQPQFYPGGAQAQYPPPNQHAQGNYFPQQSYGRRDHPPDFIKQQPRPYQ